MSHFLDDILRQPAALSSTIHFLNESGRSQLDAAADALCRADHVYLTGIGSSYHAAIGAGTIFHEASWPVCVQDAGELLHFASFPPNSAVVLISRSGQSVEVLQLLAKAKKGGAVVIALTNSAGGGLAEESQIPIIAPVALDHGVSVNTYSTLAATAAALARACLGGLDSQLQDALLQTIDQLAESIPRWREQLADTSWFVRGSSYYFLARGGSLASCYEARLLWEEAAKHPATSIGTAGFRHGPQEMIADGSRFGLWIDAERMREEDLAVALDLKKLKASAMLIGRDLPEDAATLVFQLPPTPPQWQFLFDIIPAQLAAERFATLSSVDCDSFRICSYIVRNESGLLDKPLNDRENIKRT